MVTQLLVGGGAYRAGLLPGDLLVSSDGRSLEGMTVEEAVEVIRGRAGTRTQLVVDRVDGRSEFAVERGELDVPDPLLVGFGCVRGDCENGTGVLVYQDRGRVEGTFVDGNVQGTATHFGPDGSVRQGQWRNSEFLGGFVRLMDMEDGVGRLRYPDGVVIDGDFRNGVADGLARLVVGGNEHQSWFSEGRLQGPPRSEILLALIGQPRYGTVFTVLERAFEGGCDEVERVCVSEGQGVFFHWSEDQRVDYISFVLSEMPGWDAPVWNGGMPEQLIGFPAYGGRSDVEAALGPPDEVGRSAVGDRLYYVGPGYRFAVGIADRSGGMTDVTFTEFTTGSYVADERRARATPSPQPAASNSPFGGSGGASTGPARGTVAYCIQAAKDELLGAGWVFDDQWAGSIEYGYPLDTFFPRYPDGGLAIVAIADGEDSQLVVDVGSRDGARYGTALEIGWTREAWGCAVAGAVDHRVWGSTGQWSLTVRAPGISRYAGRQRVTLLRFHR
jgi:hypothetical protein